ncbi:xanthine dehydrogenase family protein molybdopterin-binding subunit [Streptomyces sp. SAS_267]|uniref:xanthine dehydrogenase family protein molybdopterin-binding subunit n=1 Tax=unclassified Streptomyces TaxID=2593676 RepID=UPI00370278FE
MDPYTGKPIARANAQALLSGTAEFIDDIDRPGMLWVAVARSPTAHGRLTAAYADHTPRTPGLVAVFTADDLPAAPMPLQAYVAGDGHAPTSHPVLARGKVLYHGQPVAAVVAQTRAAAVAAAAELEFAIETLPAVMDADLAATDTVRLHRGVSNVASRTVSFYGLDPDADIDEIFAQAPVVVSGTFSFHRQTASPLEVRGLVAEFDQDTACLTMWGAAKNKHANRARLAAWLKVPEERVRLVEVATGGSFGVRGELYPEDYLLAWLATRLGRPLKWTEDREEHFRSTNHARDQRHHVDIAATEEGALLAMRDRYVCDLGAFVKPGGNHLHYLTGSQAAGPYRWSAVEVRATSVMTNKTPTGVYRGPGVTEATFARERCLDLLAQRLGMDPMALRADNLVPSQDLPTAFVPLTAGEGREYLLRLPPIPCADADYPRVFTRLTEEATRARAATSTMSLGQHWRVGLGVAAFLEMEGVGPWEQADISTDRGRFLVRVGVSSVGQGVETALAQIAADELGVPISLVSVEFHDTASIPQGFGAFGSRTTVMGGNAIRLAADDFKAKAAAAAAALWGLAVPDVAITHGSITAAGRPDLHHTLASTNCSGFGRFEKPMPGYTFGAAAAVVAVDSATGKVRVLQYVTFNDAGRAVNPAIVEAQIAGAAGQGIAAALGEEVVYDDNGLLTTRCLGDYDVMRLDTMPPIDVHIIEYPASDNPLQVKGVGEAGMPAAPAAVANAVADALGPAGRRVRDLPLRPERVWAWLNEDHATDATRQENRCSNT